MAKRDNKPVKGELSLYAAILVVTVASAAPVLAATDRSVDCGEKTVATLEVAETEFSTSRIVTADDAVELLGADFELPGTSTVEEGQGPKREQAVDDNSESAPERDSADPVEAGTPIYKRQMYRRDI